MLQSKKVQDPKTILSTALELAKLIQLHSYHCKVNQEQCRLLGTYFESGLSSLASVPPEKLDISNLINLKSIVEKSFQLVQDFKSDGWYMPIFRACSHVSMFNAFYDKFDKITAQLGIVKAVQNFDAKQAAEEQDLKCTYFTHFPFFFQFWFILLSFFFVISKPKKQYSKSKKTMKKKTKLDLLDNSETLLTSIRLFVEKQTSDKDVQEMLRASVEEKFDVLLMLGFNAGQLLLMKPYVKFAAGITGILFKPIQVPKKTISHIQSFCGRYHRLVGIRAKGSNAKE